MTEEAGFVDGEVLPYLSCGILLEVRDHRYEGGYSAQVAYTSTRVSVSLGTTHGSVGSRKQPMANVRLLDYHIDVTGGADFRKEIDSCVGEDGEWDEARVIGYALARVFEHFMLNPQSFYSLIDHIAQMAKRTGRGEAWADLRKLIGVRGS